MAFYRRRYRYRRRYVPSYRRRRFRRSRGLYGFALERQPVSYAELTKLREKRAALRSKYRQYMRDPSKWGVSGPAEGVDIVGLGDYQFAKGSSPSFGARVGAWAGDKLGGWLGRITGLGDYTVNSNSLMGTDPPRVSNGANLREIIISHREYIGDVVTGAAGTFASSSFLLNPGNAGIFPWLSQVSSCFQQYKFRGIVFEFKTMSADALNSTNTALGTVIMASNYNVLQPNFSSKSEMENTEFSSSCKPSCSMYHPIECDPRDTPLPELYIAPGGVVPDGGTPQFYDFCNFQIATTGFQASNVNIGELWVTYEVALLKPIQPTIAEVAISRVYQAHSTASIPVGGALNVYGPYVCNNVPPQIIPTLIVDEDNTLPVQFVVPVSGGSLSCKIGGGSLVIPVGSVIRIASTIQCSGGSLPGNWVNYPPTLGSLVGLAHYNSLYKSDGTPINGLNVNTSSSVFWVNDLLVTGAASDGSQSLTINPVSNGAVATSPLYATSNFWITVYPPHSFPPH